MARRERIVWESAATFPPARCTPPRWVRLAAATSSARNSLSSTLLRSPAGGDDVLTLPVRLLHVLRALLLNVGEIVGLVASHGVARTHQMVRRHVVILRDSGNKIVEQIRLLGGAFES